MSTTTVTWQPGPAGEIDAGVARLRPSGPLTAATAPGLRAEVQAAVNQGRTMMVLELDAVTGIDAVGVATLLEARRVVAAQPGGTLVLRPNSIVCRALRETGTIAAFALSTGRGM
jgi:anti-anti-sigma factor